MHWIVTDDDKGFDGNNAVARVCPVPQAGKLSFLFRAWPDASQPGAIDISHKGPCAVYMKQMGLITSLGGHGPGVSNSRFLNMNNLLTNIS